MRCGSVEHTSHQLQHKYNIIKHADMQKSQASNEMEHASTCKSTELGHCPGIEFDTCSLFEICLIEGKTFVRLRVAMRVFNK